MDVFTRESLAIYSLGKTFNRSRVLAVFWNGIGLVINQPDNVRILLPK